MFEQVNIETEMTNFFSRKYRLAVLALASFLALC
jgi:hypothetical protein